MISAAISFAKYDLPVPGAPRKIIFLDSIN